MNLIDEMCNAALIKIKQHIDEQSQILRNLITEEFALARKELLIKGEAKDKNDRQQSVLVR